MAATITYYFYDQVLLAWMTGSTIGQIKKVGLVGTSFTPSIGDTWAGQYSPNEVVGAGYVQQNWPSGWTIPTPGSNPDLSNTQLVTFTQTSGSPVTVYGYFLLDITPAACGAEIFITGPVSWPSGTNFLLSLTGQMST